MRCKLLIICASILFVTQSIKSQWYQVSSPSKLINKLSSYSNKVLAGTYEELYFSSDNGNSWESGFYKTGTNIIPLAINDSTFLVGTKTGIYKTANNCLTWDTINIGLTEPEIIALTQNNSYIFASSSGENVFRLSNLGGSWEQVYAGTGYFSIFELVSNGSYIYAIFYSSGNAGDIVKKSTDNGLSWEDIYNSPISGSNVPTAIAVSGSYVFLGLANQDVYGNCIFISSDYGTNWHHSGDGLLINNIIMVDSNVVASTDSGIYLSTNRGQTWEDFNEGLTDYSFYTLNADEEYIIAGMNDKKVWRRSISDITGTNKTTNNSIKDFSLEQNYPNPFNSETNIDFHINKLTKVTLTVFDILGNAITELIDKKMFSGEHLILFNANNYKLSSGIYFYKLKTPDGVFVKKMIYLK